LLRARLVIQQPTIVAQANLSVSPALLRNRLVIYNPIANAGSGSGIKELILLLSQIDKRGVWESEIAKILANQSEISKVLVNQSEI